MNIRRRVAWWLRAAMLTAALSVFLAVAALALATTSCVPATTVDTEQIEAVIQEYYDAFNCYDIERVDAVIADRVTQQVTRRVMRGEVIWVIWEKRESFLRPVVWAESVGFRREITSVVSVQVHGNFAVVGVDTVATMLGNEYPSQIYFHHLVCEHGVWKINSYT